MSAFQEYIKLITEAGQTIAEIGKVNNLINKLRAQASKPINIKVNFEQEKIIAGEKKIRAEKQKTADVEHKNIQQRLADYKAIKAMNAEQGGRPHNVPFGSPQSLSQGRQFNTQLEETTKRINKLADAHKHIAQVAKAAGVSVSPGMANTLSNQTVNRADKAIKDEIRNQEELNNQRTKAIALSMRIKEENAKIEASAGAKAQREMENALKAENEQKMRGIALSIKLKDAEERQLAAAGARGQRQYERDVKEQNSLNSNQKGWRGYGNELIRDARRYSAYGAINQGERALDAGFHAERNRSKETEALFQAGFSEDEKNTILKNAAEMASQHPVLSRTEAMTLQRHAVGEVGTFEGGERLAGLAAPFVSLRTAAMGEEAALSENQKIMKGFNELGWVKSPNKMKLAYDQLAKMSQVEGANFDVGSWLQIIRMAKGAKFAMSDEGLMKLAPLISIGEGAGRTGNEFAMLFKTLAFEGKALDNSIGKSNHQNYVDGTVLSNNKGGFNPELARLLAEGTPQSIRAFNKMLNDAAAKKGVNPEDPLAFKQWLTHVIANQSAQELAMWFHEKPEFIDQQYDRYRRAGGVGAEAGIESRDINVAGQAAKAKFEDAAASIFDPWKRQIIGATNTLSKALEWTSNHPDRAGIGTALAVGGAVATYVIANPGQAANTLALGANTAALYQNTGSRALGGLGGGGIGLSGILGAAFKGAGLAGLSFAIGQAMDQYLINSNSKYDTSTWTGVLNQIRDDLRLGLGLDKPKIDVGKNPTGVPSFTSNSSIYGPVKRSPWGEIGTPIFGLPGGEATRLAAHYRGGTQEYWSRYQPPEDENSPDLAKQAIAKAGQSIVDGASKIVDSVGSIDISGAGGTLVSAIKTIADEISSIHIQSPSQNFNVPNTGLMRRGPQ